MPKVNMLKRHIMLHANINGDKSQKDIIDLLKEIKHVTQNNEPQNNQYKNEKKSIIITRFWRQSLFDGINKLHFRKE